MTTYDGRVTVNMDIHIEKDWQACRAEATLDRGERHDVQSAGTTLVRYSPEHDRYLVSATWDDFRFFPTWDLAFARFLEDVAGRVRELGREYHDRSRVKVTEAQAPRPAQPRRR